jgi:hypothetical protein
MDIPPGDAAYIVTDSFEVPVDVEALSIYPHAHYTGKTMDAWAVRPDGVEVPLLRIPAWDFDWQDEYWFAQPIALPAGTRLHLKYVYDNSAANPRNPFSPPRRGRWGPRSSDVMGDLWLQVVARDPGDHARRPHGGEHGRPGWPAARSADARADDPPRREPIRPSNQPTCCLSLRTSSSPSLRSTTAPSDPRRSSPTASVSPPSRSRSDRFRMGAG